MNRIEVLREKVTKLTGLLTDKKVTVTQRGVQAYVRYTKTGIPEVVNIPYIPENATEEFTQAIEGFLDHEVAHVLFTSGAVLVKADKLGVGGFHNAVEDIYIETAMGRKFPGSKFNIDTMHGLFIRDYVDANYQKNKDSPVQYLLVALLRAYAGQRAFIEYIADKMPVLKEVDAKLGAYCREKLPNMTSSEDALTIALEIRRLLEENKKKEPPPEKPQENPEKGEPNKGSGETPEEEGQSGNSTDSNDNDEEQEDDDDNGEGKNSPSEDDGDDEPSSPSNKEESDNGDTDDELDDDVSDDDTDTQGDDDGGDDTTGESTNGDDDDTEKSDSETEEGTDGESSEASGEDEQADDGEKVKSDSGDNESDDGKESEQYGDEESEDQQQANAKEEDAHQDIDMNANGFNVGELQDNMKDFDELMSELITRQSIEVAENSEYLIFTRDFDVIEKFDVSKFGGARTDDVTNMQDKVDHMVGKMQRDLERAIASQNKTFWTGGNRSGRLDTSALNRMIKFGDEKIFKRKTETRSTNTAISLLIDCSGSMQDYNKITTAAYTAYALSSTLERLGVNHEVIGFTTVNSYPDEAIAEHRKTGIEYSRYDSIFMPIFKSFGERMNAKIKEGIASLSHADWLCNNVDGECLAIAAQRLAQQKEARKILIVLSDGNPVANGDKSALRSHLKKVVDDISKSSIEVLGIGIMDDAVKTYYPKHLVIEKLEDLPTIVMGQLKKFLAS